MTRRSALTLAFASAAPLAFGFRQGARKRLSPHETASVDLGGQKVIVTYGRPYLKGRKVGGEVAPAGEVWRLGADEATKITLPAAAKLGSLKLAPGSYALFAITGADSWTLVVNSTADQWGAFDYDKSKDVGRFTIPVTKPAAPVEEFTIAFKKQGEKTANMTLAWGNASVSTTLTAD